MASGGLRDMIPAIARTGGLTRQRGEGCSGGEGQHCAANMLPAGSFPGHIGAVPPLPSPYAGAIFGFPDLQLWRAAWMESSWRYVRKGGAATASS